MRVLEAGLAASLAGGVTTLCDCWKFTPHSGPVRGFTNHDRDLAFGGAVYEAATGFTPSAFRQREGLAVDTAEIAGAVSSAELDEGDLAKGYWDEAACELWRVDWANVTSRALIFVGTIGEVERGPLGFRAELRSRTHGLNRPRGRVHAQLCDADLGDARCGFNLAAAGFTMAATVTALLPAGRLGFTAAALNGSPSRRFKAGKLTFTSGANAGQAREVKDHFLAGGAATLLLTEDFPETVAPGDAFTVSAGCDKTQKTCHEIFGNGVNHRGFPAMVGNDYVVSGGNSSKGNGGGPLGWHP